MEQYPVEECSATGISKRVSRNNASLACIKSLHQETVQFSRIGTPFRLLHDLPAEDSTSFCQCRKPAAITIHTSSNPSQFIDGRTIVRCLQGRTSFTQMIMTTTQSAVYASHTETTAQIDPTFNYDTYHVIERCIWVLHKSAGKYLFSAAHPTK